MNIFYILARSEGEAAIESLKIFSGIHTSTYESMDDAKTKIIGSVDKLYDIAYKNKGAGTAAQDTAALVLESYYKDSIFKTQVSYSNGTYSVKILTVFPLKPYFESTFEPFHPSINNMLRAKGLLGTEN